MVTIPFTPPTASINRVALVDLPGLRVDEGVLGHKAYHLLSALAVIHYARQEADALQLPHAYRDLPAESPRMRQEAPRYVDACLSSPDVTVRAAAEAIARRLGRNLGYILVTLHRGDCVNQNARPDWTDAEWKHWATIQHIWIGGGLMNGELGRQIVIHAQTVLHETGYADILTVERTPHPHNMALLGAARYLLPQNGEALCFDFGQTGVKRARVTIAGQRIIKVTPYPTLPVTWAWENSPEAAHGLVAEAVRDFISQTIAQTHTTCRRKSVNVGNAMIASLAAYVREGVLLGNGIYARIMNLGTDARVTLAAAIQKGTGACVNLELIHDGTAAAAHHAGEKQTAVLVIGTAIGVGFPTASTEGLLTLTWDDLS